MRRPAGARHGLPTGRRTRDALQANYARKGTETMRRHLIALASLSFLVVVVGCTHTAGSCDCDNGGGCWGAAALHRPPSRNPPHAGRKRRMPSPPHCRSKKQPTRRSVAARNSPRLDPRSGLVTGAPGAATPFSNVALAPGAPGRPRSTNYPERVRGADHRGSRAPWTRIPPGGKHRRRLTTGTRAQTRPRFLDSRRRPLGTRCSLRTLFLSHICDEATTSPNLLPVLLID